MSYVALGLCRKLRGGESENLSYGSKGLAMSIEQEMSFLKSINEETHSVFYTAWQGSELIGTARLGGIPRRMRHRAELAIAVAKAEWDKGIGTNFMNKIIENAQKNDIEILSLEVRADNSNAIHLYKKFRFVSFFHKFPLFSRLCTMPASKYVSFSLVFALMGNSQGKVFLIQF